MPIMERKPESVNKTTVTPTPSMQNKSFKGVVVDDKVTPLMSMAAYLDGSPWQADVLKQVVGEHNELRQLDGGQAAALQSFELVRNFELRVTTPLSSSFNADHGTTTVQGSAIVLPFIVVNVNDMFVAEAGDGRRALFRVTRADRKTFNRDTATDIDYILVKYWDEKDTMCIDLMRRVVREYVFVKDRLVSGTQPLLLAEDLNNIIELNAFVKTIIDYNFSNFFTRRCMDLFVPETKFICRDPGHAYAWSRLIDPTDHPNVVKCLPIRGIGDMDDPVNNVWKMLLQRSEWMLRSLNRYYVPRAVTRWPSDARIQTARYNGSDAIMMPATSPTDPGDHVFSAGTTDFGTQCDYTASYNTGTAVVQLVKPFLNADFTYLFSAAFYDQDRTKMTLLERLVSDYMSKKPLDVKQLNAVAKDFFNWNLIERFYYSPVLILLIRAFEMETTS